MSRDAIPELSLSEAWYAQRFDGPLRTVEGAPVKVVFRGSWTRGFGPDFRDAMVVLDGRQLCTGSIEIHSRTSHWTTHGHGADDRYNDVVLHVVLHHDGAETRRADGALVPVVELAPVLRLPLTSVGAVADWSQFGGEVCARHLAHHRPTVIRDRLWRLGDIRLAAKAARFEARLTATVPGQLLYEELWDALGYSANRTPMRALATLAPLSSLDATLTVVAPNQRRALAQAILFGAAGFLPLSPHDAHAARLNPTEIATIEALWSRHGAAWHHDTLQPTARTRARVRPANHPIVRLAAGAELLAATSGGLVATLLEPIRHRADPITALRHLFGGSERCRVGDARIVSLIANALIPFAMAYAEQSDDTDLLEAAATAWERLPGADPNEITRRAQRQIAGEMRLGALGSRGQQGLIHLDQTLCAPRRCYECPIAHAVLEQDPSRL